MLEVTYLKLIGWLQKPDATCAVTANSSWVDVTFTGPAGSELDRFTLSRADVSALVRRLLDDGVRVPQRLGDLALKEWESEEG